MPGPSPICTEKVNDIHIVNILDGPFSISHKLQVIIFVDNVFNDRNETHGNK